MQRVHEKKFWKDLSALFTGAQTDGKSGFVNLMRIKNCYYEEILPQFKTKIDDATRDAPSFREELFEKLNAFFSRYFCEESGSVYFRHIPSFYPAWEQAYADGSDTELVWKTRDLYYVKTDRVIASMPVDFDHAQGRLRFFFDAEEIEHRQSNEKRDFVFEYAGAPRQTKFKGGGGD